MDGNTKIISNPVPEIFCGISIQLKKGADLESITGELRSMGIGDIRVRDPRHELYTYVDFAMVNNERFWELSVAMAKMFSYIEGRLTQIRQIGERYRGVIYIDIAFYQHGVYPVLEISGENMEKIRELKASIRMEPYAND